jgi:hypothetical protein
MLNEYDWDVVSNWGQCLAEGRTEQITSAGALKVGREIIYIVKAISNCNC